VLGVKCGMLTEWDDWGMPQPLTVIKIDNCIVSQVKTEDKEGYTALQLGAIDKKIKRTTKPLIGHFEKANSAPKRHVAEFRVTPDALLPAGTELFAAHFVPGQKVDVAGTSKGKGFAGVMKRWGFKGGGATHGNSRAHRKGGSTGNCQDPGKTFKGKKMAGQMGNKRITVQNVDVYKVDVQRNLMFLRGSIPGSKGSFLEIRDAVKGPNSPSELPFPTISLEAIGEMPKQVTRPPIEVNPYIVDE